MEKICPVCSCRFQVKSSHFERRKYCSKECMAAGYQNRLSGDNNPNYRGQMTYNCQKCGKEIKSRKIRAFCSNLCGRGEKKAKWKEILPKPTSKSKPDLLPQVCLKCPNIVPNKRRKVCDNCLLQKVICVCTFCGTEFAVSLSSSKTRKYCSRKCNDLHRRITQKGENSHFWQG